MAKGVFKEWTQDLDPQTILFSQGSISSKWGGGFCIYETINWLKEDPINRVHIIPKIRVFYDGVNFMSYDNRRLLILRNLWTQSIQCIVTNEPIPPAKITAPVIHKNYIPEIRVVSRFQKRW
jgi:hypothetical protein